MGGEGTGCWPEGHRRVGEENEESRHADTFGGESVAVRSAGALQQAVGFHLAQVVAELSEGIGLGGEAEGTETRDRDHGLPLPARDKQVEQNRTPAILVHQFDLEGAAAVQL